MKFVVEMLDRIIYEGVYGEYRAHGFAWVDLTTGLTIVIPYTSIRRITHYPEGTK